MRSQKLVNVDRTPSRLYSNDRSTTVQPLFNNRKPRLRRPPMPIYEFYSPDNNKLYQFAWNGSAYQYGHNSIPELTLTNIPADADASSFAMLHK